MNLGHACAEFLTHCRVAKNLSPHTLRAYGIDLDEFQRFAGLDIEVTVVDRGMLRGYFRHLFDVRKLKETSVRRRIACLKVLFRWLEQEDGVPITPFHRFDGRIRVPQRLPRSLTRDELRRLLAEPARRLGLATTGVYTAKALATAARPGHFPDLTTLTALEVFYCTGMRVGELAAVTLADVDLIEGVIVVNGKGSRQRRVFLPDDSVTRLTETYLKARADHGPQSPSFMVTPRAHPATTQFLRELVTETSEQAGLRRITPHMLRHTTATHLLEAGVDIRFVQKLLGHHSITTTEGYTRVSDTSLKEKILGARLGVGLR
jgi:integrase/recombinase XerD